MNLALEKGERVTTGGKAELRLEECWNVRVLHNLPPNTDQITRRHLELAYQFVLSSTHSPGIKLR